MKVVVQDRQCLVDIALQVCGSLEAVFVLAERNRSIEHPGKMLSVTDDLVLGQVLEYDRADIQDRNVVARYNVEGICPAGAVQQTLAEELAQPEAIETGKADIEAGADPVQMPVLTRVFKNEFNIQFA